MQDEKVYGYIVRMFSEQKIPHAMLVVSDRAIDAARIIAASIICEQNAFPGCGACRGCKKSAKDIHPDIITVSGEKSISVDQIRQLRLEAFVLPNDTDRKVFIIDRASTMTVQAQNALLKILEQPPRGVFFLLADHTGRNLLDTVLSRVTQIVFRAASEAGKDGAAASDLISAVSRRDEAEIMRLAEKSFDKNRDKACAFLEDLMVCLSQTAVAGGDGQITQEMAVKLYEQAKGALQMLENAGNVGLCAAWFAIKCWEAVF